MEICIYADTHFHQYAKIPILAQMQRSSDQTSKEKFASMQIVIFANTQLSLHEAIYSLRIYIWMSRAIYIYIRYIFYILKSNVFLCLGWTATPLD